MVKSIKPYKQTLYHGCLIADLLMLLEEKFGTKFTARDEAEILLDGMKRTHPFYVIGVPNAFASKYKKKVNIIVDNKYFADMLRKAANGNVLITAEKISITLIRQKLLETPLICHIDDNFLGDYSHASHFIILEKANDKTISIIDPMNGKRSNISDVKLASAIVSLKKHIKMCPLLYHL